jgi:adenosylcobinamide kinase/adenosylcobinamide-phosphate guanylyltransferase
VKVQLLGTGSADGWPNAFCRCASCQSATTLRSPTCALVDDTLLLDCGPETPRAALRHAGGLHGVTHLLITHDHPDHSAPMALLSRSWAANDQPLVVIGPPPVIAAWRQWVAPDAPVTFTAVAAGDRLAAGRYDVRVLAANHRSASGNADSGAAVLYDVTDPAGARLLYATDTGPLPSQTWHADGTYDVVLLEATLGDRSGPGAPGATDHLDLADVSAELRTARSAGAIDDSTVVIAVHLSHHNPPDLARRLGRWGVQVVDDGTQLVVGAPQQSSAQQPGARRTLVLGGARSGKSALAERLLQAQPHVVYVAPGPVPSAADPDWLARVQLHQARRPSGWTTCETTDVATVVRQARQPVLVDCLGTWLTAVLDGSGAWQERPGWRHHVDDAVDDLLDAWHATTVTTVAVSNEVGSGVVPATASGRLFRDELGRLNARVASASERVLLVVAGREIDLSGTSSEGVR